MVLKIGVASSTTSSVVTPAGTVTAKEVRGAEALGLVLGSLGELVAVCDGVPNVDRGGVGHAIVKRVGEATGVLHLARKHATLHRQNARDAVAAVVLALDHNLSIERKGNEGDRARGNGLGEPLADESPLAEDRDRSAFENRVGRVLETHRFEGKAGVAARALGIVEVDDLAVGLGVEDRDHRRGALGNRHRAGRLEVRRSDRIEGLRSGRGRIGTRLRRLRGRRQEELRPGEHRPRGQPARLGPARRLGSG